MTRRSWPFALGGTGKPAACRLPVVPFLACLAVLLLASTMTTTSGATFVGSSRNRSNLFAAGDFRLQSSSDGGFVISAAGLRPGQSATGTATLTCQSDFAATFSMTRTGLTDTPSSPSLSAALTLKIEDITGTAQTLWSGSMGAFVSLALGRFDSGQARTYRFTVTFPLSSAVPALQGTASNMQIRFVGVTE